MLFASPRVVMVSPWGYHVVAGEGSRLGADGNRISISDGCTGGDDDGRRGTNITFFLR